MDKVCVTGASSFLSSHIISQLLSQGYQVHATVRSEERAAEVQHLFAQLHPYQSGQLTMFICDLASESNWRTSVNQCKYVIHTASPFSSTANLSDEQLISEAVDGTLRVLRHARDAGVEKVIMTSSFGAIGYGQNWTGRVFDERDWTDLNAPNLPAYIRSKTLAEKAAWEFNDSQGENMALSVINPVGIFGPVPGKASSSTQIISALLSGSMPLAPKLSFGVVDVRDAAQLHLSAMLSPKAAGERFIANQGRCVSIMEIAEILRSSNLNAGKLPGAEMPNWAVRLLAKFNKQLQQIAPQVGVVRESTSAKAREVLGWSPRPLEETILDTARSLVDRAP